MNNQPLQHLAQAVARARGLEDLTRPLLELLERLSGLESTYLTRIDEATGVQEILFSRNDGALQIPEEIRVPWHDTLCRRALEEDRFVVTDVPVSWGDSQAASDLGIQTYTSVPVYAASGEPFGTLCGASGRKVDVADGVHDIMRLFSELIAFQIDRDQQLSNQQRRTEDAELRAAEMQLVSELSSLCLAATSLNSVLGEAARRLADRPTWLEVLTFSMHDRQAVFDAPDPSGELSGLIETIVSQHGSALVQSDLLLLLDGDDRRVIDAHCRGLDLPEDGTIALIIASNETDMTGGILLFGNRIIPEDGNEARLLRSCSNLLSLLATRLHDLDQLHLANRQLALDAMHDTLTGLPNRRYLIEETGKLLSREARGGGSLHVAFIDLDGFKQINDQHGHEVGDQFLIAIADRLRNTARASDIIARYGGDEFVVIATSGNPGQNDQECERISARLSEGLAGRYDLGDLALDYAGPSVGCVSCSEESADIDDLLKQADADMYRVKQQRRGLA